jgi:hypothetical protein
MIHSGDEDDEFFQFIEPSFLKKYKNNQKFGSVSSVRFDLVKFGLSTIVSVNKLIIIKFE